MDEVVAQTPMPLEYRTWAVEVLCNDCHETSSTLFHVVGLKCGNCGGYNTRRAGSEPPPEELVGGEADLDQEEEVGLEEGQQPPEEAEEADEHQEGD